MAPVHAYNIANRLMRRIRGATEFDDPEFGGVPVLFGGDLRQLAPICGTGELETDVHFSHSELLKKCIKLSLEQNMRTDADELEFANLLKRIGEGKQPSHEDLPENSFLVPKEWVLESQQVSKLITWTFGDDASKSGEDCAILTHLNKTCKEINTEVFCLHV